MGRGISLCPFLKTMKYIFPLLLILFYQGASAQHLNFRTDGYYFFDNKCDTIYISKKTKELYKIVEEAGIKTFGKAAPCVPPGTVSQDGSSHMRFFYFLSDREGTAFGVECSDTAIINKNLKRFQSLSTTKLLAEQDNAITGIKINADNTFIAQFGKSKFAFRRITGKIFSDRIEMRFIYPPNFQMYDAGKLKICRFYKFGTMPPLRKKFILKYRVMPNN